MASASVSATCARCPPERLRTFLSQRQVELGDAGVRRLVVPARVELAADAQHLLDGEAAVERVLLREEADVRQSLRSVAARIETEHAHGAGARPRQPDGETEQRRLAGAVRADERGHAPARDLERAVAQRPLRAVAPAEPVRLERCGHATLRTAGGVLLGKERLDRLLVEPGSASAREPVAQRAPQLPDVVAERRRRGARDERPLPAPALGDPLALERRVRLEDGVRVDRQARDDFLHRRKLVAGPEDAELDGVPHLLHELQIGRNPGARVEMELDQSHISSVIDKVVAVVKHVGSLAVGTRAGTWRPTRSYAMPAKISAPPTISSAWMRLGEDQEREEHAEERLHVVEDRRPRRRRPGRRP